MKLADIIYNKLSKLNPQLLEVINESNKHIGHAGHDGTGESHFKIKITAEILNSKPRLAQHKMIYNTLKEEMQKIHALNIIIK